MKGKVFKWLYLYVMSLILCIGILLADRYVGLSAVMILVSAWLIWLGQKKIGFEDLIPT